MRRDCSTARCGRPGGCLHRMARRIVLHVGLMKSGTTYVQRRLGENASALGEQDVVPR